MAEKKLLREWIALEYKPDMIKESREKNAGKIILQGVLQRSDTKNQNKRIYPDDILRREVENYQKAVRENRAVGELDHPECVTNGYYLLSSRGWLPIEEIQEGDSILTLNLESDRIVSQNVLKKIDQPYCGKMVHIWNSKGTLEQVVTPNHRLLLWDRLGNPYYLTAEEFVRLNNEGDSRLSHSYMRRAATWEGEDPDMVVLPGTDITVDAIDWASFLGIWLAEGYADGTRGKRLIPSATNVVICQKEGTERHGKIVSLLERMGLPYEMKFEGRQFSVNIGSGFHSYFFNLGNSQKKHIPSDVKMWSPRLLSTLLDWMLMGDGSNRIGYKKKNDLSAPIVKEYATVSRRLAEDVQEVMVKLGYGGTIHSYNPPDHPAPDFDETGRMILAENCQTMHIVYGHGSRTIPMDSRFVKSEFVDYDGRVYCVQVKNGNWLARSPSGQIFWTGNSSSVSLKNASHIIREMGWNGNTVVGRVEVLSTPAGKILESLLEDGVMIGISSRGVGSTEKTNEGSDMVQPDFQIICFDIVSEPSTPGAYLMPESVQHMGNIKLSKPDRVFRALNDLMLKR